MIFNFEKYIVVIFFNNKSQMENFCTLLTQSLKSKLIEESTESHLEVAILANFQDFENKTVLQVESANLKRFLEQAGAKKVFEKPPISEKVDMIVTELKGGDFLQCGNQLENYLEARKHLKSTSLFVISQFLFSIK